MPSTQIASPAEFRPYRRFVSWLVLSIILVGSIYLLSSVGVSIYRRRHVVPSPNKVSAQVTESEIRGCFDELDDVRQGLEKHLENFHHLLASYDPAEAQRWAEEGYSWNQQWRALGQRCRFGELPVTRLRKELEQMAAAHEDLGQTHDLYTSQFKSFGSKLAPRMDRIRDRMKKIGERLNQSAGSPPQERTSHE
ncbi:MAG TPA: hypothetical protein VN914_22025 [Polyangia bacterium]|nr:hypothetical protein [Polyangia bacterium]